MVTKSFLLNNNKKKYISGTRGFKSSARWRPGTKFTMRPLDGATCAIISNKPPSNSSYKQRQRRVIFPLFFRTFCFFFHLYTISSTCNFIIYMQITRDNKSCWGFLVVAHTHRKMLKREKYSFFFFVLKWKIVTKNTRGTKINFVCVRATWKLTDVVIQKK